MIRKCFRMFIYLALGLLIPVGSVLEVEAQRGGGGRGGGGALRPVEFQRQSRRFGSIRFDQSIGNFNPFVVEPQYWSL